MSITLLGLGPGSPELLTRQAWELLHEASEIYLRTRQHPVVAAFPETLTTHSFDALYEGAESFEQVYAAIVERVLELGSRPGGVIYAVPGHPFVAEATAPEIARRARQRGIPVRILSGISFLEAVFAALGVDPFPHTSLVDAFELANMHVPPFPPDAPALIAQIHSRQMAAEVKLTLMALYPDEHPVHLVHAAGTPDEVVESLALYEIDRSPHTGLLTSLYLPPLGPHTSMERFQEVVARLRAPDGCPWDRQQTHQSMRPHLLEETYEVLEALDEDDPEKLAEELGDLLFQIVFHAQIGSEAGTFDMAAVAHGITTKLIRRHPHVFGDVQVEGVEGVLLNWERLKAKEQREKGDERESLLDGVPRGLPALAQSRAYQRKAARAGFDQPDREGVYARIAEALKAVRQTDDAVARAARVGDLLFVVARLADRLGVDPETALREANARFRQRFEFVEQAARSRGREVGELGVEEMNALWEEAKQKAGR